MMQSLKIELEKYFKDSWLGTPIQFQGSPFTQPADGRWISLVFIPIDRQTYAYDGSGGRKADFVQFKVISYDTNPTAVLGLDDSVRSFLECFDIPNHDATCFNGEPDGLGILDLGNGVYETASLYNITSYN